MRKGIRFGLDVGQARIGLARSDQDGMLAVPVGNVAWDEEHHFAEIAKECADYNVLELIVGLPISLSGSANQSADLIRDFAQKLQKSLNLPVRLVDERLTTVSAQSLLHSSGKTSKSSRKVIDQLAATIILQQALDTEKNTGLPPGELIE